MDNPYKIKTFSQKKSLEMALLIILICKNALKSHNSTIN